LAACGEGSEIHPSAVIVEPAAIRLGEGVTIEPLAVLMGDPEGEIEIGDGTLVGAHAYLQGLGGVRIGAQVGIGAGVLMLTAVHAESPPGEPITAAPLRYGAVEVADGCDVGIGSMLLPGAYLEAGVQVGAGAVVRGRHRAGEIIAGAPARTLRMRGDGDWARALDTLPPGRRGRAG